LVDVGWLRPKFRYRFIITLVHADGRTRCAWPSDKDSIYIAYHDEEWGVPEWDDRALFEKLLLDGFQAGLSWITILKKRDNFRRAFDGFEPAIIANYDDEKLNALMTDAGIVRNRAKIYGSVTNARAYLDVLDNEGSFADYLWQFTDGKTLDNRWSSEKAMPAKTPESEAMSKTLKKRGFKFVGPTICYAFMQAVGMVNDHVIDCFRHDEVSNI
jgi:DNA-3-methyladenine glycosylase I